MASLKRLDNAENTFSRTAEALCQVALGQLQSTKEVSSFPENSLVSFCHYVCPSIILTCRRHLATIRLL